MVFKKREKSFSYCWITLSRQKTLISFGGVFRTKFSFLSNIKTLHCASAVKAEKKSSSCRTRKKSKNVAGLRNTVLLLEERIVGFMYYNHCSQVSAVEDFVARRSFNLDQIFFRLVSSTVPFPRYNLLIEWHSFFRKCHLDRERATICFCKRSDKSSQF